MNTILFSFVRNMFIVFNNIIYTVPRPHAFVTMQLQSSLKVNLSSKLESIDKIICVIDDIFVTYNSILDRYGVVLLFSHTQENIPKDIANVNYIVLNGCIAAYESGLGLDVNSFVEAFTPP